jgi:hypothetical protein
MHFTTTFAVSQWRGLSVCPVQGVLWATAVILEHLKILPLQSQYMLSLFLFVVDNKNKFKLNYNVYNMNIRQKYNFHLPLWNLSLYQKEVYFTCIKMINILPQSIRNLSNDTKQFKSALKNYPHPHPFYSIDEYFNANRDWCKIKLY